MPVELPQAFCERIVGAFGRSGSVWLPQVPDLVQRYASDWGLSIGVSGFDLSYNYVTPATMRDGTCVVLKLGVPHDEIYTEIAALSFYDGKGAARLIRSDPAGGALLLERVTPGTMLIEETDDSLATEAAALLIKRLTRPAPEKHGLFTVERWSSGLGDIRNRFAGGTGPLPGSLVERAETIYREFLDEKRPSVVLHGDLHHENILFSANRGWLAIDPKGVVGEPEYEPGALLRNPSGLAHWPDLDRVLARRLDQVSQLLSYDRKRLALWSGAQAVLSACWGIEDSGEGWREMIHLAERFLHAV